MILKALPVVMLILPLLVFVYRLVAGKKLSKPVPWFTIAVGAINLIISGYILYVILSDAISVTYQLDWFKAGKLAFGAGIFLDKLSASMLFVVWAVSLAVQVYSLQYMNGDRRFIDYFAILSLFSFAMSGLVVSSNLLVTFVFWELVGVCSYLLIGFWYDRSAAGKAAVKAFIVTRLGDLAFFVGIAALYATVRTLDIVPLAHLSKLGLPIFSIAGFLLFLGAVGKSAQFPLHVWLPDAMEGPTPVSALIHAATMVAAGIYVIARVQFLYASVDVRSVVLAVGLVTALMAALIAVFQRDIKRTLAFSTISQLGYMMAGLGAGAFAIGMYHLITHAFFKALLFLAAGSIFHAVHSLDIQDTGGLFKKMKWTGSLFLIGALNLAGFPLTGGFFSKDSLLFAMKESGLEWAYYMLLFGAFITSFYIFKVFFRAFLGAPGKNYEEAHESRPAMIVPMLLLAVFSMLAGLISFTEILKPAVSGHFDLMESIPGAIASVAGIVLAYLAYGSRKFELEELKSSFSQSLYDIFYNRLYIDDLYEFVFLKGYILISKVINWFDRVVVDGIVNGAAWIAEKTGEFVKPAENGVVQFYLFYAVLFSTVISIIYLLSGGRF